MAKPSDIAQALDKAPTPTAIASPLESLLKSVSVKGKFEEILGKKTPGFISSILTVANMNKDLRACDPKTIIASAAIAASLDLPINPSLGFAHIVPYKGRAQFQMGWRGFVQLGIRSGQYEDMNASEVYEDEIESWNPITGELKFTDPKSWKMRDEGKTEKVVGFMASFKLLNGFHKSAYMTKAQAMAHGKRFSQAFASPNAMWQKNPNAMCLKTIIKLLLSKWGIMSIEMQKAQRYDQAVIKDMDGKEIEYADAVLTEPAKAEPFDVDAQGDAIEPYDPALDGPQPESEGPVSMKTGKPIEM